MKSASFCFLLLLAMALRSQLFAAEAARPNILYFYVDDMGWGSIGPNGQEDRKKKGLPYVRTPNLDELARQGLNFTRGYGCHVCSPARSSQQSGFHQGHTFADRNDPNNAKKAMRADDVLMGDALSAAGYVTGYWGKWGYGASKDRANPVVENIQTLPTSHGYQYVLAELHHVRAHTFFQPTLWSAPTAGETVGGVELVPNSMARYQDRDEYPNLPAIQNHADYPSTGYCDDAYAFAALDFVRREGQNYNKTGKPFFGLLAAQIPHAPFREVAKLPEWNRAYVDDPHFASLSEQSQQWAAMVTRIDGHFGNILAALEDPNHDGDKSDSIVDQTLVVFQSDNGGPKGKNNVEFDANGGLRGFKGSIQEGGIRVPLVMRWPAKITAKSKWKSGSSCDRVVDVTDLLPTFCELAGARIPLGVDGVSIAPTILGEGRQRHRDFIIHEAGNGQSIIQGNHKLVRSKKGAKQARIELYDLGDDPLEVNDVAQENPKLVAKLNELLLGERVAEPRGFANTYHRWTGKDGARMSDADNWSDYMYSNDGITYQEDAGAPQLSWVASIHNANVARADSDLEFLAVEIGGIAGKRVSQTLTVGAKAHLTGRNEIRVEAQGVLDIEGGKVTTLRWIDVLPGGTLAGTGSISGTIYNAGAVAAGRGDVPLVVGGDYHQTSDATLSLSINLNQTAALVLSGEAQLDGVLQVSDVYNPSTGDTFFVVAATKVVGRFSNEKDEVVSDSGRRYQIGYSETAVTLTAK